MYSERCRSHLFYVIQCSCAAHVFCFVLVYVQNSSGYLVRLQNTGKAFIQRSVNLWLYLERWINNLILFLEEQGVLFFWETWFVSLLQFIYVSSFCYGLISETLRICGTIDGRKMNMEYWWTRENRVLGVSLSNWRCVQHQFHMDSSGIETYLPWWENGT
jgi:hypothetical protein